MVITFMTIKYWS